MGLIKRLKQKYREKKFRTEGLSWEELSEGEKKIFTDEKDLHEFVNNDKCSFIKEKDSDQVMGYIFN